MHNKSNTLAENIVKGSGGHGMKKESLIKIFNNIENLEDFTYTLKKLFDNDGKNFLSTQLVTLKKPDPSQFTKWYHIDDRWEPSWGFSKKDAGCYLYGYYPQGAPAYTNYLDEGVIYMGESRASTRNSMLGRRTDFRGTVRKDRLSPYGCGTAFKKHFEKNEINNCYQAYLPMHSSLVKDFEMNMLIDYYKKFNRIPICNPDSDLRRVKLKI
jgi:hypothetical protein